MENGPNLTFLTFKIDLYDDSTKSILLQYISTFLRKPHAKKEKKLSGHFWEINHLSEKLMTDDDRRRRRTTDESVLEKLRCHSAGGAKKLESVRTLLKITLYLGSHIWSLFAQMHMKSWRKYKLGQVEVSSNIAQNRLFSR